MAGRDPAIHAPVAGAIDMPRRVDHRVKPGDDGLTLKQQAFPQPHCATGTPWARPVGLQPGACPRGISSVGISKIRGSSPRMTFERRSHLNGCRSGSTGAGSPTDGESNPMKTLHFDWSQCADVEKRPRQIVRHLGHQGHPRSSAAIIDNAEDGYTAEQIATEIFDNLPLDRVRGVLRFAKLGSPSNG
jgi:hypothetical protein